MLGFFIMLLVITVGVVAAIRVARGLERGGAGAGDPALSAKQLDRLESALSSLESRVDDLQEQQRFLERLLDARPERPRLEGGESGSGDVDSILFDRSSGEDREAD